MQALHEIGDFKRHSQVSNRLPSQRSLNFLIDNSSTTSKNSKIIRSTSYINPDSKNNSKNEFHFRFVSESELEAVLRQVRRSNRKKRDEEQWQYFLKLKQGQHSEDNANSVCKLCSARELASCSECGLPTSASSRPDFKQEEPLSDGEGIEVVSTDEQGSVRVDDASHVYQLGPGLTRRLQDLLSTVRKMTSLLLQPNLHSQFEDEDVDRSIKRSLEFDAMFSRNHLYEIQRLLKNTKQLATNKPNNTAELEVKISAALKSVTQALQVYTRHVSKGSHVKYQQVVPIFESITSTLELLEQLSGQRLFPMRKDIELSCSYMKEVLLEISVTETRTVSTVSRRTVHVRSKHKPSADLSMYNRRPKADWQRKSATLARLRFGPPCAKRHQRKSAPTKETVDEKVKKGTLESGSSALAIDSKFSNKTLPNQKETTNVKEVPFRNATRAVPEENVTTMMEMIPHEPLDDCNLYMGDNTFQISKLLNRSLPKGPLRQDSSLSIQNEDGNFFLFDRITKLSMEKLPSAPTSPVSGKLEKPTKSSSNKSTPRNKLNVIDDSKRPMSAKRPLSARSSSREASNVQLIFLREGDQKNSSNPGSGEEKSNTEIKRTTLTVDEGLKKEALQFRQKMIEYQKSSPRYKDGKALGIVDRIANNILSEMIMDFQQEEMDQVVRTLYNLEFDEAV